MCSGLRGLLGPTRRCSTSPPPAAAHAVAAIFDRSFAVTYYLQAVAIAIGLVGIAASLSAQVLARRKEFGLLAHLGLTRRQVIAVVAGEGRGLAGRRRADRPGAGPGRQRWCWCTWSTRRASTGPWSCCCPGAGVLVAGTLTAALSARAVAGRRLGDMVIAVREDW
jgi:putative ABC transport system permease protein